MIHLPHQQFWDTQLKHSASLNGIVAYRGISLSGSTALPGSDFDIKLPT